MAADQVFCHEPVADEWFFRATDLPSSCQAFRTARCKKRSGAPPRRSALGRQRQRPPVLDVLAASICGDRLPGGKRVKGVQATATLQGTKRKAIYPGPRTARRWSL